MKYIWYYKMPVGTIAIAQNGQAISHVMFGDSAAPAEYKPAQTDLITEAARQLEQYFLKKREIFNLPLYLNGTDFQMSVWQALQTIEYGKTCSYKDIACQIKNPKAVRAVGMANNKNPISIIIPCHRVIGSSGDLIGYGGGLEIKKYLLNLEKDYA